MGKFAYRKMASCVLLFLFPSSIFAADSSAAMLYTNGAAWINGSHVPRTSSAIFSGDLLQTRSDSVANINQSGSSVTVFGDSMVEFQSSAVQLEHGGVTVSTSKKMSAVAGDVRVSPASDSWTEFNVVDNDGTVRISAKKGDLLIADGKETFTLQQGQETSRDETAQDSDNNGKEGKKNRKRQAGASPAAGGGILSSPYAVGAGAGAVAGLTIWVLIKNDNPASPSKP
ncbi:MAG TPA: hypothetical protein VMH04_08545 [Candidatus Solibacter sp.]|jgi:hypothetical protein|nr:hypothetical protein [Candidatus Solibacter sp.]